MINANELRIGNWIKDFGDGYGMVRVIDTLSDDISTTANLMMLPPENYSPIPLTPEILEKCSFQKSVGNPNYFMDDVRDIRVDITFVPLNGYQLYYHQQFIKYIHSVHELQNTYYCLTGKELEINL